MPATARAAPGRPATGRPRIDYGRLERSTDEIHALSTMGQEVSAGTVFSMPARAR
ncbi:MAG TPA: hypothetical protein VGB36_00980 [Gammaproteobacteria bacterium]|jgi:hypothetical protein